MKLPRTIALFFVRLYQCCISPLFPPCCRFRPTCSAYACEAFGTHGVIRGGWLILRRIVRCHPWNEGGYDPVPPAAASPLQRNY